MKNNNGYKFISKALSNEGGHLKVNKILISKLGIEAAFLYSELLALQIESMKNNEYQIIDDEPYFIISIEKLNNNFGLSAHKQRSIIAILQEKNLLKVFYTTNNVRMVHIIDDIEIIYDLLTPSEDVYSYIYENISYGFNSLKDFILKNVQIAQKRQTQSFYDKFEPYLKHQLSTFNDEFKTYLQNSILDYGLDNSLKTYNSYDEKNDVDIVLTNHISKY